MRGSSMLAETGWPRVVTGPELPQTRTCSHLSIRFLRSGIRCVAIERVHRTHWSQWVTTDDATEFRPSHRAQTVPAIKPLTPSSPNFMEKPGQGTGVTRDAIVRIMPAKLLVELRLLLPKRSMSVRLTPQINAPH